MKGPLIGILAGMGPRSTGPFLDLVVTECQRQYGARDDIDFPKMMICSQPAPFYEDLPTDHEALEAAIREGLQDLERTGADFLAIACNTAHIYYPRLAASVGVPVLNMVELTLAAVPESARKLALIAARATAESRVYQDSPAGRRFEWIEAAWQPEVDRLLGTTRTSMDPALFAGLWQELMEHIRASGADMTVIACLDLSGILRHAPEGWPIVDASRCLAEAIVEEWRSRAC